MQYPDSTKDIHLHNKQLPKQSLERLNGKYIIYWQGSMLLGFTVHAIEYSMLIIKDV